MEYRQASDANSKAQVALEKASFKTDDKRTNGRGSKEILQP
jgi:hypothetical protein